MNQLLQQNIKLVFFCPFSYFLFRYRFWSSSNHSATAARQQVCTALDSANQMMRLTTTEDACMVVRNAACQLLSASSATLYLVDRPRMLAWAYVQNSTELHRVSSKKKMIS